MIKQLYWRLRRGRYRPLWTWSLNRLVEAGKPAPDPHLPSVYDRQGLALIHIPKCAGTSIEEVLYNYSVKHRTWCELYQMDPEGVERWTTFAVIRHPVDRFLSAFAYLASGGRNRYDREFSRRMIRGHSLESFTTKMRRPEFRKRACQWFHLRPQCDYICDQDRVMVDRLFRFDCMDQVSQFIGRDLPHLNESDSKSYEPIRAVRDTIEEIYASDYEVYRRLAS